MLPHLHFIYKFIYFLSLYEIKIYSGGRILSRMTMPERDEKSYEKSTKMMITLVTEFLRA